MIPNLNSAVVSHNRFGQEIVCLEAMNRKCKAEIFVDPKAY